MEPSNTNAPRPKPHDIAPLVAALVAGNGLGAYLIWNGATVGDRNRWPAVVAMVPVSIVAGLVGWRMGALGLAAGVLGSLVVSALLLFLLPDRAVAWKWRGHEANATASAARPPACPISPF